MLHFSQVSLIRQKYDFVSKITESTETEYARWIFGYI